MSYLPQELVHHRYRILALLGQGEYGAVYRAWDERDEREVALKEHLDPSTAVRDNFRRQVRELERHQHPQRPAVLDFFTIEDVGQYLVSEYIPGVSLQELLDQYGPLPADVVVPWLHAAATPLHDLHQKGQLHLNLKPANIRLTPQGNIFVVDTGLPLVGSFTGTAAFASPEQAAQGDVTPTSDVYSLGATLYTLLTNKTPPPALHRQSGLAMLSAARDVNPDVPPYLSLVANRALSQRADARYDTAEAFAQALRNPRGETTPIAQSNTAVGRRTPSKIPTPATPQRPAQTGRTMPTRTIWALVVVLLLLVITVASMGLVSQQELVGGSEEAATATMQSQVISALTAVAPTNTPTPLPTLVPPPTPPPLVVKTGQRMLYVPGGVFRFGNDDGNPDEGPARLVNLDPFYIDETEVTNAQYAQCVADEGCAPPIRTGASYHSAYYGSLDFADYPVIFVNWYMARDFCDWRDARLPSEAEWERAAGFDPAMLQRTFYPWGDEFDGTLLNYCDVNCPREDRDFTTDDGHRDTAVVKSYPDGRSSLGVYDMLGNVMEWTADWYDRDYYEDAPERNPRGPAEGEFKSIRGGSWLTPLDGLSITRRTFFDPLVTQANLGFRCASDIP